MTVGNGPTNGHGDLHWSLTPSQASCVQPTCTYYMFHWLINSVNVNTAYAVKPPYVEV